MSEEKSEISKELQEKIKEIRSSARTPNAAKRADERIAALMNGKPDPYAPKKEGKQECRDEKRKAHNAEKKAFQRASRKMLIYALLHGGKPNNTKADRKKAHKAALEKRKLQLGTSTQHGSARQILQQQQENPAYPISWRDIVRGAHIV